LLFMLLQLSNEPAILFGAIVGAILGGLSLIAEAHLKRLPSHPLAAGAWVVVTCLAWGICFGWVHDRLCDVATDDHRAETRGSALGTTRRGFLVRLSASTLSFTAVTSILATLAGRRGRLPTGARWSDSHALPNEASLVIPVPGTRAEFTRLEDHYRVDTNTRAPQLDVDSWRLTSGGLVDRPGALALADLRALPATHQFITLSCISNPVGGDLIGTSRWSGVSLQQLLPTLAVKTSATHLKVTSADGFFEVVALDAVRSDPRIMLAYD